jgi:hypothetical protein
MIYCVNEPGWGLILDNKHIINLTVGDKLYSHGSSMKEVVNLIYIQSEFMGIVDWYWKHLDTHKMTMLVKNHRSNLTIYPRDNIKSVVNKGGLVDITSAVSREIKIKSLGI